MSPKQLILANPIVERDFVNIEEGVLEISEFFCDTIQGEGIHLGHPAAFLRLQHCTLNCVWCDTQEVWKFGNPYTFIELYEMMESSNFDLVRKLRAGQHLVLTGGSPLKQQIQLTLFIQGFIERYGFKPYIEVENETTLMPMTWMISIVDCWNNSPKLENSGNTLRTRYNTTIIKKTAELKNSWFKFVVTGEKDWDEIEEYFLIPKLITKSQIILMPQGETREELYVNCETVIELAVKHNVRYSSREHIAVWDKKTGV